MKKLFCIVALLIAITLTFPQIACVGSPNTERTKYTTVAVYDEQEKSLTAKMTVDFVNQYDVPLDKIVFNLYANAYEKNAKYPAISSYNVPFAYPAGVSYGNIEILSVKEKDRDILFDISEEKNLLSVMLSKELYPNEKISLLLEFELQLANVHHRLGVGNNAVNMGNFLPIVAVYENGDFRNDFYSTNGDPFISECSDFDFTITLPDDYIPAFTGDVIDKKQENGKTIYTVSAENIREFAMVFSKKYKTVSTTIDNTVIEYYYYNDEKPEENLELAKQAVKLFSESFLTYPYASLRICETNFYSGGMEYPSLVYISDSLTDSARKQTIVHEIAHQWWYGIVGNNQVEKAYIDEGLAEFSTMYFFDKHKEYGETKAKFLEQAEASYALFCKVVKNTTGKLNTSMNRSLNEYQSEYEYVILNYTKPLLMFAQTSDAVGEKRFIQNLSKFANKNKYKIASLGELKANLGGSVDIEPLIDSYISGKS